MNGKMTAAVLYGKEDIKIEQVPIPRVGEGEVLIKVQVALTCGTDLKVYQRGYHARMIVPPALFGHELAGVIEQVGTGVRGFKKGMRVVALNSAPCGMCFFCSKHQENLCEDLLFNNGAYAEYIRVPRRIVESNMLAIPSRTSTSSSATTTRPLLMVGRELTSSLRRGRGTRSPWPGPSSARRASTPGPAGPARPSSASTKPTGRRSSGCGPRWSTSGAASRRR